MASLSLGEDGHVNATNDAVTCDSTSKQEHSESTLLGTQIPERTIETVLRQNRMEGDLMWSFFVSAAKSYRFSSILHPFPPMYNEEGGSEKLVIALVMIIF